MNDHLRFGLALAAVLATATSRASFAQDVVANGNFATDLSGWEAATDTDPNSYVSVSHTLNDGSPAGGAASFFGYQFLSGRTVAVLSQCVSLATVPPPWTLAGRVRTGLVERVFGTCDLLVVIEARLSPTANCAGPADVIVESSPRDTTPGPTGPFTIYGSQITTDPNLAAGGSRSAAISLFFLITCLNGGKAEGVANFDSIRFGYIPDIFAAGFEAP